MKQHLIERVVNRVIKEANFVKAAKLFDVGDNVTLVDQVEGLNKGSIYKVTKNENPGKITIAEIKGYREKQPLEEQASVGDEIGEYDADRFVRFNNEI